jgi:hypothetical protein
MISEICCLHGNSQIVSQAGKVWNWQTIKAL